MHKVSRSIALLLACVLLGLLAAGACHASRADKLFADAAKAASRAKTAKSSADREDGFKKSLDLLRKVTDGKMYTGRPQQALALYQMALVQQDMAKVLSKKQEIPNLRASHDTLKRLINLFDKSERTLSENLEAAEVRQIMQVVSDAKRLKLQVDTNIDGLNAKDWKYKVLDSLVALTGRRPEFSYWFAVILITILVKLLITPLTKLQFKSMKEMQRVAPLIKEIQEKNKGDQRAIQEKTMDLYKEHKINPFASCLPLLVQMPILWLLYLTISSYEFQFAKGTFLWIGSGLSHLTSFNVPFNPAQVVWVTAKNLAEPDLILLVLYLLSMYVSTKLSAVDPTQAEQQKMMAIIMPVMFAFIFAGFPAAFLLYWLTFNILQTAQQYLILKPHASGGDAGAAAVATPPPAPSKPADSGGSARVRRRRRR